MGSLGQTGRDGHFDVVIIGGGFGGCYMLHKLRKEGYSTHLVEAGAGLGGVWHWNSYPGARVDSEMPFYQYSHPDVYRNWDWSQRFPGHEEIKAYFKHVDRTWELSQDISYETAVIGADFDENAAEWSLQTSTGKSLRCKWLIAATGSSYKCYEPSFPNMDQYKGRILHAASWPAESGVDLSGKNVAVIGAGATAVQCVQEMAKQAGRLSVYIRNPNIALPMGQREISPLESRAQKALYQGLFQLARQSAAGIACDPYPLSAADSTAEEREAHLEELWSRGGFSFQTANFSDFLVNMETNKIVYEFWARKVRKRVKDPAKREILCPLEQPYPVATKRCSLEQDYYEILDREDVDVVGLKKTPIREFTSDGIMTEDGVERKHDVVVLATGYDNMTGSLTGMGLRGKDGVDMKERWKDGVWTHLGIMSRGNPNMFMIYGPQAPTAFTNAPVFLQEQVDFVVDWINKLREEQIKTIEPKRSAEEQWKSTLMAINDATVFPLNDSCSWYLGANIPGKKREPLNYIAGIRPYADSCREALRDWTQFDVVKEDGTVGAVKLEQIPALR